MIGTQDVVSLDPQAGRQILGRVAHEVKRLLCFVNGDLKSRTPTSTHS